MPELPEVETIVRDLDKKLRRKKIISVLSSDKKALLLKPREVRSIIGREIKQVRRRAKMIIFDLGRDILVIHLKMTGQLVLKTRRSIIAGGHPIINQSRELPNRFTRVIFRFSDRSTLFFNDVRRFGWIKLINGDNITAFCNALGVEPLSSDFTLEYFKNVLSTRPRTTIKQVLLDQKHISGIGNIYADETVFAAGLKPFRRVRTLQPKEVKKLWQMIPKILSDAIKYRGTSFSDYVDAQGRSGNFVRHLKVYGRAGEKCKKCSGLVKKIKLGGRGTHWCDNCQR